MNQISINIYNQIDYELLNSVNHYKPLAYDPDDKDGDFQEPKFESDGSINELQSYSLKLKENQPNSSDPQKDSKSASLNLDSKHDLSPEDQMI